jgi:hypothetical protein
MSYNASIPVATTSPALFPALAQTNWSRLQTIIGADHQFNLGAAANDGYHNLVHMQIPAVLPSGALASLGRLYVNTATGQVNLFYMDDAGTSYQITPQYVTTPLKVAGSQLLASGGDVSILNPSYDYTGYAMAYINGTTTYSVYSIMKSGGVADRSRISQSSSSAPDLSYSTTDLRVRNDSGSAQTIVWSLMVNRL